MSYFYALTGAQGQKDDPTQMYKVGSVYILQSSMHVRKTSCGDKLIYRVDTVREKNGEADNKGCSVMNKETKVTALQITEVYGAT